MVCHVLFEGQGWSPDHPDLIALSPHSSPRHCGVNIKPMSHGRMYEIFIKHYKNNITKWSGIGQEK